MVGESHGVLVEKQVEAEKALQRAHELEEQAYDFKARVRTIEVQLREKELAVFAEAELLDRRQRKLKDDICSLSDGKGRLLTGFLWDFGDGNMSTAANPVHTYTIGGGYTVTLIAMNDCGSTTFVGNVSFPNLPVAAFDSDMTSGCGPLEIQFNDNSTCHATCWNWSFLG